MRGWSSVLSGFAMAVLSILILGGSLLLSILEGGSKVTVQPTASFTMTSSPGTTQFIITARPSRTATPTLAATDTPTPTLTPTSIPTQTSTSVPPSVCPSPEGWVAIVVLPGDTLSGLASIYQADEDALAQGNCLEPGITTLQPGGVFYVPKPSSLPSLPSITPVIMPTNPAGNCGPPPGWVLYIVHQGDTLSNLSQRLNVPLSQLRLANCIDLSAYLYAGQPLFVPFLPPVEPSQSPPPPVNQPFPFTPVYTLPAPPSSMNNFAPMANEKPSASTLLSFAPGMEGWSE